MTHRTKVKRGRTLLFIGAMIAVGITLPSANAASVMFITDTGNHLDGDDSVVERLENLGHTVETVDHLDVIDTDPVNDGFDLVVISSSTLSTNVDVHLTDEPIPVINWENALSDELLFSDGGTTTASDVIDVLDISHPLAGIMGLTQTGEIVVRDAIDPAFHLIDTTNFAPGGVIIAEEPTSGGAAIAVFDEGVEMVDGSNAAATRISLYFGDLSLIDATDEGLAIFDGAIAYALGIDTPTELLAGDANMDLEFNQLDLVQVQIAAKYLTGQAATWGEGDWNGAPGGEPGSPPAGNGFFDQLDIIGALGAGTYLTGPYAAVAKGGTTGDDQTSLVYDAGTGELSVDPPAGKDLTSINITSAGSKFVGDKPAVLDGAFDNFGADNIFKATFGGSFGSITFGNALAAGIGEDELAADLSAVGSLAGGGDLGAVDLVYVPEPTSLVLTVFGVMLLGVARRARRNA